MFQMAMSLICRACLQPTDFSCFSYLDTFDNAQINTTVPKDLLLLCVPEMDLYISEQPGICNECLMMFECFSNFKNKCLASEERILNYMKKNKLKPQNKVNLTCVIYDVSVHMLYTPEEPKAAVEDAPADLIQLRNVAVSPHSEIPNNKDVVLLSCNECSFVTMDKTKLADHKCLTGASTDNYKCPYCQYSTNRRYRLSNHINNKHLSTVWHDCQQCDFKTMDLCGLKKHQKLAHSKVEEPKAVVKVKEKIAPTTQLQACQFCDYKTKDKSNFRKHQYIHGDKPRKCTKCTYQCISPYQLEKHYKKTHVEV